MKYVSRCTRKLATCVIRCFELLRATRTRWSFKRVRLRLLGGIPRTSRCTISFSSAGEPESEPADLAARMLAHLDACACLMSCVEHLSIYPDVHPEFRHQAHVAQELAFALSLYPALDECPQLRRAHDALTSYWSSAWSDCGVTDGEYRCALKSAVLFLKRRAAAQSRRARWDPAELLNRASQN